MTMQADIFNDLQDTGLLHYAESWGVINDVNKLLRPSGGAADGEDGLKPAVGELPGYLQSGPNGLSSLHDAAGATPFMATEVTVGNHNQATNGHHHQQQQPEDEPMQQQGSSGCVDDATSRINAAADAAAATAQQAVLQARTVLQDVTTNTAARLAPMASTNQPAEKPAGRSSRKGRGSAAATAASQPAPAAANPNNKGLRQFAMKVCEKVRERGRTTYNEVADLLVTELSQLCDLEGKEVPDDKTIRRRVYDAINVLMAMEIIEREKKDIIWKGMPGMGGVLGPLPDGGPAGPAAAGPGTAAAGTAAVAQQQQQAQSDLMALRQERLQRISEVERKQCYLQELVEQHTALKQLIHRNAQQQQQRGGTEIHLPFILIQARPDATVEVQISEDMQDVTFDIYNSAIQIHDDSGIIKQMAAAAHAPLKPPGSPHSMQS